MINSNETFDQYIRRLKATYKKDWFLYFREDKNSYFEFIDECRKMQFIKNRADQTIFQIHHIIPRYLLKETPQEKKYCESDENTILLPLRHHIHAHVLFNEIYPDPRNKGSVDLLRGFLVEATNVWHRAGAYKSHEAQRKARGEIFSVEHQKMAAQRSLERPDALLIRSKAGKVGGRKAKENIVVTASDKYLWFFNKEPVLCTINCKTGQDIVNELNKFKTTKIQRVTPLLKKTRKVSYNWSCEKLD